MTQTVLFCMMVQILWEKRKVAKMMWAVSLNGKFVVNVRWLAQEVAT